MLYLWFVVVLYVLFVFIAVIVCSYVLYWEGRMAVANCQINNQSIAINHSVDRQIFRTAKDALTSIKNNLTTQPVLQFLIQLCYV